MPNGQPGQGPPPPPHVPGEYEPPKRKSRAGCVWTILVLLLLAALAGFLGWRYWKAQRAALRRTRTELREARGRLREARTRERETAEGLAKRQSDFDAERTRMQAELQGAQGRAAEADTALTQLRGALGADEGEVGTDAGGRITLALVDRVLFRSGDAQLTPGGIRVLSRVGEALRAIPDRQVWVQGHTDDEPIRSDQFASNWELSTARAVSVVHYLQDEAHVPPRRLAAVGFSQYRPIAKTRAKNRRIEIVLFPSEVRLVGNRPAAATAAPATTSPTTARSP